MFGWNPDRRAPGRSIVAAFYISVFRGTCVALGFVVLAGCKPRPEATAPSSQILRISQRNEPGDLDPAIASLPDDFFIIRALSEGLVAPSPANPDGSPNRAVQPAAAIRWDISADGLTYTFYLRKDARWSNGDFVTAQDFVASYERLLTPTTAAPKAALFHHVKNAAAFNRGEVSDFSAVGFRAIDATTLQVTLERPTPQFLLEAASGPWIPANPRSVAAFGRQWTRPEHYVGNGPFVLVEWRPHQRIIVKNNPAYHSPNDVHLDEIRFVAFDSGDAEERAYRAGQIDITMAVPVTKLESYARERSVELHRAPLAETRFLSFNVSRPPLNDPRVRHALGLAIDRPALVERVLRGGQIPATRFLSPALIDPPNIRSDSQRGALPDAEEARRLLADAGFKGGAHFPDLELSAWPIGSPLLEAIQQMWKQELGITVHLAIREAKVHVAAMRAGDFDIGFITAIPEVADAANVLNEFVTNAPGNYPRWSDETFDEQLHEAERNPARRVEALRAAESRLLDQVPVVPLYFNSRNWLMSPRVRGWQTDALWTRFYLHVELEQN
jgi:oligopeptide transport system substrate-binding protein